MNPDAPRTAPTPRNATALAVLDATRQCLIEHGMAGTTSRAITTRAAANLGAITYYFGSKDRLIAEALLSSLRDWLEPAVAVLRGDSEPAVRTLRAVQVLVSTFEAHRHEVGIYLELLAHAPRSPVVGDAVVGLWRELETLLAAQVEEMLADGQVPGWVDPASMAALLVAVANGLVVHVAIDPEGPTMAAMAAQFGAMLMGARSDGG
jgi:AcrR family transcriptional regulator